MKKIIISALFFIFIGFIIGNFIFTNKEKILNILSQKEEYYFLQEGVYPDKENLNNNLNKIDIKVIDKEKDKYYVYVGITKDLKLAQKIQKIYKQRNINTYLKKKKLTSNAFSINLKEFDLLLNKTNDPEEILTIEEVVLANYEEIIKKN